MKRKVALGYHARITIVLKAAALSSIGITQHLLITLTKRHTLVLNIGENIKIMHRILLKCKIILYKYGTSPSLER